MSNTDLPRTAYADALINARPGDSVAALQTRFKKAAVLQDEIANFFQARANVENAYAQSIHKIMRSKPFISDVSLLTRTGLGNVYDALQEEMFQKASSHEKLAKKITEQIERPLRSASQHGEWRTISQSDSDMNKIIKTVDENQKSVYKAQRKVDSTGGKKAGAVAARLTTAQQSYAHSQEQFLSQASPYFTSYQIADMNRLQDLKSIFVRWETIQSEHNQYNLSVNEQSMAGILNWSTESDINDWLAQITALLGINNMENSNNLQPTPLTQSQSIDASVSSSQRPTTNRSTSTLRENATGVRNSIANTLFNRHRSRSNPRESYVATPDSEVPPVPALNDRPLSNIGDLQQPNAMSSATQLERVNEDLMDTSDGVDIEKIANNEQQQTQQQTQQQDLSQQQSPIFDTNHQGIELLQHQQYQHPQQLQPGQIQPQQLQEFPTSLERGPSPTTSYNEQDNAAAMSKVQQSLLASAPASVQRRPTALRGRRDVRHTVFNPIPDDMPLGEAVKNPFHGKFQPKPSLDTANERTMSMSSTTPSLTSLNNKNVFDPFEGSEVMIEGLKPAITETVNVLMKGSEIAKVMITGELHTIYKPSSLQPTQTPILKLNSFEELEKVAPNPQYLKPVNEDNPGEYIINLEALKDAPNSKGLILKYQVYISNSKLNEYVPILSNIKWKLEPTTHSVIINYGINKQSKLVSKVDKVKDVMISIPINATNVQSKPQGIYSPERKRINWKLNDMIVNESENDERILARFTVDNEQHLQQKNNIQPTNIKWKVDGTLTSNVDLEILNMDGVKNTIKNSISGKFLVS